MNRTPVLKDWILATRPWSFTVSALPAFVAMMYVAHTHVSYDWRWGIVAVLGAVIFHAGGNLLSDYHDYTKGIDQKGKQGGTETLTSGLFASKQILWYGALFIAAGICIGLYLALQCGTELVWVGIVGAIGAIFYYFFKYRALGDLLVFVLYGPAIMLGTGYVMLGHFDWTLLFVSFPMAFITVNVLHANNTRDQESDRQANIRTYAMLLGTKASVCYYVLLTILSYLSIVVMIALSILPVATLLTFITVPIAYKNCMTISRATDSDLAPIKDLDLATAKLQTAFSVIMFISLILSSVI